MPTFRFVACVLQISYDGGDTWADVPGWSTYARDCFVGPTGATGAAGSTGATGATGATGPPGVVVGPPPNPHGSTAPILGCNIAAYLARVIIQGSVQSAVDSIGAGAGTLAAVAGIVDLIPGVDIVLGLALSGGAILVGLIAAGTISHYEDALTDAQLWSDVQCAILAAIMSTGYVTHANFAALVSSVGAVSYTHGEVVASFVDYLNGLGADGLMVAQQSGSLYVGDCSACGDWCYDFDFSTLDTQGWTIGSYGEFNAGAAPGVYSGTPAGGYDALNIISPAFAATGIVSVEVFGSAPPYTSGTRDVRDAASATKGLLFHDATGGAFDVLVPFNEVTTQIIIYLTTSGAAAHSDRISRIRVRGIGANPFGASNCT
jgi:hypothetical protein